MTTVRKAIIFFTLFICLQACPQIIHSLCRCVDESDGVLLNCTQTDATQTVELLKQNQANLGLIKWLTLEKSELRIIPANFFKGLYIKRLYLIQNGLTEIEDLAFEGLGSTLQELTIQQNNLTRIPTAALAKLNALTRLDLSKNKFGDLNEKSSLPMLPKLYDINMANNKISTIHKTFFENNKNNLQTINVGHNDMKVVPAAALRGFRKLMALHVHNNKLTELPKLSFMNLPVLSLLNLASNRIESIDRLALLNVPKLRYLYLSNNKLKVVQPYQFNYFEQLEMLDLSGNQLTKLPANSFSNMPSIRQLYLGDNHISTIENSAFTNSSIVILILEGNELTQLTEHMLDGLFSLQQLSFKANQIKSVDANAFRNTTSLMMVDLGKNEIVDLAPSTFLAQLNMILVDLSSNKLVRIPYGAFSRRVATVMLQENPLVCTERVHMLQQGLGVYIPNSEDKICAGQHSIDSVLHGGEAAHSNPFKIDTLAVAKAPAIESVPPNVGNINPVQIGLHTQPIPSITEQQPIARPINIQSIASQNSQQKNVIIRPIDETENQQNMTNPEPIAPKSAKEEIPYPDDPDHPDNHPERMYPLPVPFLKAAPKLHPAYTITQTLPPSIVIADDSTETSIVNTESSKTNAGDTQPFEQFNPPGFDGNEVAERRAYDLDDQQIAHRASQRMPMTVIAICLTTVGIVMIAVFVGLCVARQRNVQFVGSSSSSTTARTNFAAQMNAIYGTLPNQRTTTLPRQSGQEDIYNWLYGHGGCHTYAKA